MLGYRHSFHAGNAADVLKHTVLVFCLNYLCEKDKGFVYIDTHAGAGSYSLDEDTVPNKEWKTGVAKLFEKPQKMEKIEKIPPMLEEYLSRVESPSRYPGSPALARNILRPRDRIICYEKHPADFALLRGFLSRDRRAGIRNADGFEGLKSLLPPPSRRACTLIDPSYEMKDDYEKVESAVRDALKRFSAGLYLVWYPLLRLDDAGETLRDRLMDTYGGNRCYAELVTEDKSRAAETKRGGLYGSGLVVYNPPWTLKAALEETLPFLARRLGAEGTFGAWRHEWMPPQGTAGL
jgi:23S rRNA (adenine2030-N6)-methyltransferase